MSKKQIILLVLFIIGCNFILLKVYKKETNPETDTRCGTIVKKYSNDDVRTHKSTSTVYTHKYFDVKFRDNYEQVQVSADTYYKNKEGENICFTSVVNDFTILIFILYFISLVAVIIDICLIITMFTFLWDLIGDK